MSFKYFKLQISEDGIVRLAIDIPDKKVNILSTPIMQELADVLEELHREPGLSGLLFYSTKKNNFIAGADINEINDISDAQSGFDKAETGKRILQRIEDFPFPTICAINGACMGGGTELSLCFSYIICSDSSETKIALPETQLGILPGFGGCVRLPERVGLLNALDMILTGKQIDAKNALRIGLVDEVVYSELLLETALLRLKTFAHDGLPSKNRKKVFIERLSDYIPFINNFILSKARKDVINKTKGKYPAPLRVIEFFREYGTGNRKERLSAESRAFSELAKTREASNCIHVYKIQEKARKETGGIGQDITYTLPDIIGVVGAGVMGGGIAEIISFSRKTVIMKDIKNEALTNGLISALKVLDGAVKHKKIRPEHKIHILQNIHPTLDYSLLTRAGFIIEAVVEDMNIKKSVFKELEDFVSSEVILATNTSALSVTEMASCLRFPDRLIGLHFFNPVHRMPLVEIIRTPSTSSRTVLAALTLARALKKTPIMVEDKPGFLVNRLLVPYINEAIYLVKEGYAPQDIDRVLEDFGMPMGPLRLLDEVGLDVGYKVAKILETGFGKRMEVSHLLNELYVQGDLGRKSGKGIYIYDGKSGLPKEVNPKLKIILENIRSDKSISETYIMRRLIYLMINEASRCLMENVVSGPEVVDTGMIFGTGFPPFRGGLLRYADTVGLHNIRKTLEKFVAEGLERYTVSEHLIDATNFYSKNV